MVLAYHNHSGDYVGAPVWDALQMIEGQPPTATGLYFDVRHATVEGGLGGWRVAAQMAAPHLRMLAIKDFYWEKGANGRWRVVDCPVGDGMVDWKTFATELRRSEVQRADVVARRVRPGRPHSGGEDGSDARGDGAGPHAPRVATGVRQDRRAGRDASPRRPTRSALLLGLGRGVFELAGPSRHTGDGRAVQAVAPLPAFLPARPRGGLRGATGDAARWPADSCRRARPVH